MNVFKALVSLIMEYFNTKKVEPITQIHQMLLFDHTHFKYFF